MRRAAAYAARGFQAGRLFPFTPADRPAFYGNHAIIKSNMDGFVADGKESNLLQTVF